MLIIDTPELTECDYVHLNPVRAGLLSADQPLAVYEWSSYPHYLRTGRRPAWLRVDRLLGEHGTFTRDPFTRQPYLMRSSGEGNDARPVEPDARDGAV